MNRGDVRSSEIIWRTQFQYEEAIAEARASGKPILLDLHSASSKGCRRLEAEVFGSADVVAAVMRDTVPVRVHVDSTEPNPITSAIVGSHIFIWSQTVQLVSADGDIYHKFLGAPRHTRLDMGYTRVHHDVDGNLTPRTFLSQMAVGMAKEALFRGDNALARDRLTALARGGCDASDVALQEAQYWMHRAEHRSSPRKSSPTAKSKLARAVRRYADALVCVPDTELMQDWRGAKPAGDWAHYTDCLREACFGAYQAMLDVANAVMLERVESGRSLSTAQRLLKAHQIAYREIEGLVSGLTDHELDAIHLRENRSMGKQRTIRNNLVHCVMAECWAHASQVRATLRMVRSGASSGYSAEHTIAELGEPPYNFGEVSELFERWETLHTALIEELQSTTDDEVEARVRWWESSAVSVRFRLGRFGWHLHDHAMVIETILERIGRKRTEVERMARLLFRGLGELEGSLIGLPAEEQARAVEQVTAFLDARAEEIERLAARFAEPPVTNVASRTRPSTGRLAVAVAVGDAE